MKPVPDRSPSAPVPEPLEPEPGASAWYAQPLLWLGVLVLVLTVAAGMAMIVLSADERAAELPAVGNRILGVPVQVMPPERDP